MFCKKCGVKLIAQWESVDRGWEDDILIVVCPDKDKHIEKIAQKLRDAKELQQGAKRALVNDLLLDHDFFEIVADAQEAITEHEKSIENEK